MAAGALLSFFPGRLAALGGKPVPSPTPMIQLRAATIDPAKGEPYLPPALTLGAERLVGTQYFIVQFKGPVQEEWKQQLTELGVEFFDYVPDFAFLVRFDAKLLSLVQSNPLISYLGPYHPAYRLSPELKTLGAERPGKEGLGTMEAPPEKLAITVQTFPGVDVTSLAAQIQGLGGSILTTDSSKWGGTIRVEAKPGLEEQIAMLPGVKWIEPYVPPKLLNDVGRTIMTVTPAWTTTGTNLFGNGEIVGVADTGLDTGNMTTVHRDVRGRITAAFGLAQPLGAWRDPDGHGTHVTGSVLGNGTESGGGTSATYANSFAGAAPEAFLVMQSIGDDAGVLTGIPANLGTLFSQAKTSGARIHTNSWGADVFGQYDTLSQQADQFLWDNKDMTVLFAAGNSGTAVRNNGLVDLDSIGSPATAKNVIAVGASESNDSGRTPSNEWNWNGGYGFPITGSNSSDNSTGMAAFSSRGPTDDGRIRPDLASPGTNIVSLRSTQAPAPPTAPPRCDLGFNNFYRYLCGTSMATPLSAAATAIVRQYLRTVRNFTTPSGALVKAALINGAVDITPGQYGTGATQEMGLAPNFVEGFGRTNLQNSLPSMSQGAFVDVTSSLATGQGRGFMVTVPSGVGTLAITLVWTDFPGSPTAVRQLVNDLDLRVITPTGQILWGNGAIGGDATNNVERVTIISPAAGSYRIQVLAPNVPNGPQPFALAVRGGTIADTTGTAVTVTQGATTTIFSDGAETDTGLWTPQSPWARTNLVSRTGIFSWTDSPGAGVNYSNNADTSLTLTNPLNLSTGGRAIFTAFVRFALEFGPVPFDIAQFEGSRDNGATWMPMRVAQSSSGGTFVQTSIDLATLTGATQAKVRARLLSDSIVQMDGIYVDDITITQQALPTVVDPPSVTGLSCPTDVTAGATGTCTATIDFTQGAATTVPTSSSATAVLTTASSVSVPATQTSATFTITGVVSGMATVTAGPVTGTTATQTAAVTVTGPSSGGGGGGGDGGGCFIATAAFGSPLAAEVQVLRSYRDRSLLTHAPGRIAVAVYYRLGPPLARLIASNEGLRSVARTSLHPLVWWAGFALDSPVLAWAVVLLGGGSFMLVVITPFMLSRAWRPGTKQPLNPKQEG